ncbi:hypothetical protein [Saccharopolyspora elongata]|uniref:Uncharacterized protein n=1 Tax=Saccharopolyspora elongata TaxID=2530387 RepID=A0A4R4YVR8_9PSEU|nr:hypothetical protein [Saccharopolyspora elongata]TDD48439.1 hypothetical protein E1288_22550 [Saccharopolyspora elongata]
MEQREPVEIKSAWAWAGFAALGALPAAIVTTWYGLHAVGSLWKKCDLVDASGGVVITFVVLPVALLLHVALGLVIPVGVVIGLAATVLAPVVVMGVAKAQIPPGYPTTCSELGNG